MDIQPFINQHPGWFAVLFPLYFVTIWLMVSTIISVLGGWHLLSKRFRLHEPFNGFVRSEQSAYERWFANYGRCLKLGVGPDGLYLATLVLFRFMHPPLLIPWSEVR